MLCCSVYKCLDLFWTATSYPSTSHFFKEGRVFFFSLAQSNWISFFFFNLSVKSMLSAALSDMHVYTQCFQQKVLVFLKELNYLLLHLTTWELIDILWWLWIVKCFSLYSAVAVVREGKVLTCVDTYKLISAAQRKAVQCFVSTACYGFVLFEVLILCAPTKDLASDSTLKRMIRHDIDSRNDVNQYTRREETCDGKR